jgi:hypothetical protein
VARDRTFAFLSIGFLSIGFLSIGFLSIGFLLACAKRAHGDDLANVYLAHTFRLEPSMRMGLFHVDQAIYRSDYHVYVSRVLEPLRGLRSGERIVFCEDDSRVQAQRDREWFDASDRSVPEDLRTRLRHPTIPHPPKMAEGRDYLVIVVDPDYLTADEVRALGFPAPVKLSVRCRVLPSNLHGIRDSLPQIKEYVDANFLPEDQKPAAMRRWALANLGTPNAFLRHVLHTDLGVSKWFYLGASKDEATRLANYSDVVGGYRRFQILEKLALHTDHPMDFWFLRALSRGAPGKIDPYDTASGMAFHDSLLTAAPKLSIDSFWPILERRTRELSPWVEAFAKKGDPRLLPIILRHVTPEDWSGVQALEHYKGSQAATRAILDLVRKTSDFRHADKFREGNAQSAVSDVLKRIGTPEALAEAERLVARLARPPGTDPPKPMDPPFERPPGSFWRLDR